MDQNDFLRLIRERALAGGPILESPAGNPQMGAQPVRPPPAGNPQMSAQPTNLPPADDRSWLARGWDGLSNFLEQYERSYMTAPSLRLAQARGDSEREAAIRERGYQPGDLTGTWWGDIIPSAALAPDSYLPVAALAMLPIKGMKALRTAVEIFKEGGGEAVRRTARSSRIVRAATTNTDPRLVDELMTILEAGNTIPKERADLRAAFQELRGLVPVGLDAGMYSGDRLSTAVAIRRTPQELYEGLRSAGIAENFANNPGVQRFYDNALNAVQENRNLISYRNDVGELQYLTPTPTLRASTTKMLNDFTSKYGAPSFFDPQTAIDNLSAARRRMYQMSLIENGTPMREAAELAAKIDPATLPDPAWYTSAMRGLQGAVTEGLDPAAARAVFDVFMGVSGSYSVKSNVSGQITKGLNAMRRLLRTGDVADSATGFEAAYTAARRTLRGQDEQFGQKIRSFIANLRGNLGPYTLDTIDLRTRFYRMLEETVGVWHQDNPAFLVDMAESLGLMGKNIVVGTGKTKQTIPISQANIEAGRVSLNAISDALYGLVASSGRYSVFTEPAIEGAQRIGVPGSTMQATPWVAYGELSNSVDGTPIVDLITGQLTALAGGGNEGQVWKRFLTGQIPILDLGAGATAAVAAMFFFEAHLAQVNGMSYEESLGEDEDEGFDRGAWTPPTGMNDERLGEIARQLNQP